MQDGTGAAISTESLTRSFGARRAVEGVSLSIGLGEALALFGPNGAGKTTLLRMLGGLLKPTAGSARIGGKALPGGPEVRRRVGLISHHTMLYDALTARENVEFVARLYSLPDAAGAAGRALSRMDMMEHADIPVRALSRGMKQRVSVARATVHDPSVVLADEPFTGLDVVGARALSDLILALRATGAAVILVTHNIEEGLGVATHAAMMHRGRIAQVESRSSLDAAGYARRYHDLVTAGG
ncbi:MAG: heme ABC exporter ATP-binding protein CcmA [Gemmatimonadaceae bacterium]|nr:heme ABC exporter ATP-binding protein CcmA [Gemmatimonadaceae bacterium]